MRKSIQINQVMMLPKAGSVQSFASIVQKAVHDRRIEAFNRITSVTTQADKSSSVYPLLKRSAWNEYQSNKDVCAHDVTHGYETLQRICENVSLPASIIAEMSPEQLNAIEMQRKRQLQQMSYEAKQSDLAYPAPSFTSVPSPVLTASSGGLLCQAHTRISIVVLPTDPRLCRRYARSKWVKTDHDFVQENASLLQSPDFVPQQRELIWR